MPKPEVWFAIPSANPAKCREALPKWRERGYKVAVLQNRTREEIPADLVVWSDHYPGWAESVNILGREIVPKSAPIIVTGGDDMLPDPNHTADELAEQFLNHFAGSPEGTFGVMQPHGDVYLGSLLFCGSPFLGRAFFEKMYGGRGSMCGDYRHNWADNELYWVSKGLGALWERPDLSHYHAHFSRTGEAKPEYWVKAVQTYELQDCLLFVKRKAAGFPGHQPVGVDRVLDTSILRHGQSCPGEWHLTHPEGAGANPHADWVDTMSKAIDRCASAGLNPIALYGAGTHTKQVAAALMEPKARIACLIDDRADAQGRRLWGYPVVSREQAMALGVKAVILSANAHEQRLWAATRDFRAAGIPVFPLYATPEQLESAGQGSSPTVPGIVERTPAGASLSAA